MISNRFFFKTIRPWKLGLLLLCFCFLTVPVHGQFQRVLGTQWDDLLFDILPVSGGGFIATGTTTGANCGGSDILLIRLDANGDLIWERSFGGPTFEDYGQGIIEASDGGWIIGGHLSPSGSIKEEMFLMKVDASGNEVWTRTYGASSWDLGYDVCAAGDGGYYLAGKSRDPNGVTSDDVYVVKTNSSGVPSWMKVYKGTSADNAVAVVSDGNGGCVVAATSSSFSGGTHPWLMRLNSSGVVLASKSYASSGGASAQDMIRTSDGGYAVTGNAFGIGNGWFILKVSGNGTISWVKIYGSSAGWGDESYGIVELDNGNLVVTGQTGEGSGSPGVMLLRTSSSGNVIHARNFALNEFGYHTGYAVAASGNGVVLAGSGEYANYDYSDAYVVETDVNGISGCKESAISVSATSVTWTVNDVVPTISNRGASSAFNQGNCQIELTQTALCPNDCEPAPNNCYVDHTISGDVVWTTSTYHGDCGVTANVYIERTLYIEPDAKLTISPGVTVYFGEQGRIILKNGTNSSQKGGQLELDGALITNGGDCPWQGIEVWGDATESQYPLWDTRSGYLHMKNGATVQNAETAVRLWKPGDLAYTGGIVKAYESTFRNNRLDVEIPSYQNFVPAANNPPANNLSFFQEVTFITDGPLISGDDPYAHVSMEDVEGVSFKACYFRNTTAGALYTPDRGYGIIGIDSRFSVGGKCTSIMLYPCNSFIDSEFSGLFMGINAMSVLPTRTVRIDNSLFENNYVGVQLSGMDYARTEYCTFDMGAGDLGMVMIGCSDFKVEENLFTNTIQPTLGRGMVVMNSGKGPNQIYRNAFTDIAVGINPMNINDGPSWNDGLQLRCNTFEDCNLDIGVTAYGSTQDYNIAKYQGGCGNDQTTANNSFSHTCSASEDDFFIVKTHPQKVYYYSLTGNEPQCHDLDYMVLIDCGPEVPGGLVPCATPCIGLDCMEEAYATISIDLAEAENNIDGGNTPGLLVSILSDPAATVHENLGGASPYLSDEVLIQAVNDPNDPMSEVNLLDILIRNSPLEDAVREAVDAMVPPLSPGARASLDAAQMGVSERQKLEGMIATLASDRKAAMNGIIGEWLFNDTVPDPVDSILVYLLGEPDEDSRRNEIAILIEKEDYIAAASRLADFKSDFPGSTDFSSLQEVVMDLKQHPDGLRSLRTSSTNVDKILNLTAEELDEQVWRQAYLVWELNSADRYVWEMAEIDLGSPKKTFEDHVSEEATSGIRLYPNPAGDRVQVSSLNPGWGSMELSFYDPFGREIGKAKVKEGGNDQISLSEFPAGLYLVRMVDGRGRISVEKLLIRR